MAIVSTQYLFTAVRGRHIPHSYEPMGADDSPGIGSATFGHYWIYIYDYQNKIFRKYNDGYVTKVSDESEVFTHDDNNHPPTPYFLGRFPF